jgi:hypothetical protein
VIASIVNGHGGRGIFDAGGHKCFRCALVTEARAFLTHHRHRLALFNITVRGDEGVGNIGRTAVR